MANEKHSTAWAKMRLDSVPSRLSACKGSVRVEEEKKGRGRRRREERRKKKKEERRKKKKVTMVGGISL